MAQITCFSIPIIDCLLIIFIDSAGKEPALPMQETKEMWVRFLVWEDPLEKEMITHSSILAWEIPRTDESGRLQSMKLQGVEHN